MQDFTTILTLNPDNDPKVTRANIIKELAARYPDCDFSGQTRGNGCTISYKDGPSNPDVWEVLEKYIDHSAGADGTEYHTPTGFTSTYGGFQVVRIRRYMSHVPRSVWDQVKEVITREGIEVKNSGHLSKLATQFINRLFSRQSFPGNPKFNGLEPTGLLRNKIEDRYRLTIENIYFRIL